ncbi:hypothetical protein L0Y69_03315 [bacterium]|nr:hypothetical protein [bacterium]
MEKLLASHRGALACGDLKLPRTPRLCGDANQCTSDTLADSRVQNPKIFLPYFRFSAGGSRQKMEQTVAKIAKALGVPMEDLVK